MHFLISAFGLPFCIPFAQIPRVARFFCSSCVGRVSAFSSRPLGPGSRACRCSVSRVELVARCPSLFLRRLLPVLSPLQLRPLRLSGVGVCAPQGRRPARFSRCRGLRAPGAAGGSPAFSALGVCALQVRRLARCKVSAVARPRCGGSPVCFLLPSASACWRLSGATFGARLPPAPFVGQLCRLRPRALSCQSAFACRRALLVCRGRTSFCIC